ncbi:hypothetical protein Taro_050450 [Colocasia esculenta]|uniref:Uncharacterized protein n=1 Tax=Colocasia esculenta TaxID=4460 RepID=A0A843XDG7_COLES|nr:hypothetical protein [Colocasia esculenta]
MEVVPGTKGFAKNPSWCRFAFMDSPRWGDFFRFLGFFRGFLGDGRRSPVPPAPPVPSAATEGGAGAGGATLRQWAAAARVSP